jgi:hypothetical protein
MRSLLSGALAELDDLGLGYLCEITEECAGTRGDLVTGTPAPGRDRPVAGAGQLLAECVERPATRSRTGARQRRQGKPPARQLN